MRASVRSPAISAPSCAAAVSGGEPFFARSASATAPSGGASKPANAWTVSPPKSPDGSGVDHAGATGQATSARSTRAARIRANMRRIAASASSFGATNSHAPPVASASRRSTPSAGALPMPTTNTRCRALRASAIR